MQTADKTLDAALINKVVRHFYARVRADDLLGPIFQDKIGDDWEPHLNRMVGFWSAIMLGSKTYSGRPHALHQPLPIEREHFTHWLSLFHGTLDAVCPPQIAPLFLERAMRIAQSLQAGMGIFPYAPYPYAKGERTT